jgi:hypothetical protein
MNFPRDLFIKKAEDKGHSKEFIQAALDYIDNLINNNLPVIFSRMHLATYLNKKYFELTNLIDARHNFYSYYLIKKKKAKNEE